MENVDVRIHGFSRDGIPCIKDIVRVDLVRGFVLPKVDSNKSYFRLVLVYQLRKFERKIHLKHTLTLDTLL